MVVKTFITSLAFSKFKVFTGCDGTFQLGQLLLISDWLVTKGTFIATVAISFEMKESAISSHSM
jgi:hypothetical protein